LPPFRKEARSALRPRSGAKEHAMPYWGTLFLVGLSLVLAQRSVPAYGEEVPRLTFAQLADSIKANFELSRNMQSYNGKEVEVQGFIIPAGPPDLSFFLLSRVSSVGNYCCEAPVGQDETVYVFTAKGVKIAYDPLRVYKVRGLFEAGQQRDTAYGISLFRLRRARVEEAIGAKIMKMEGDSRHQ
jgi:hypothetical protein